MSENRYRSDSLEKAKTTLASIREIITTRLLNGKPMTSKFCRDLLIKNQDRIDAYIDLVRGSKAS